LVAQRVYRGKHSLILMRPLAPGEADIVARPHWVSQTRSSDSSCSVLTGLAR